MELTNRLFVQCMWILARDGLDSLELNRMLIAMIESREYQTERKDVNTSTTVTKFRKYLSFFL